MTKTERCPQVQALVESLSDAEVAIRYAPEGSIVCRAEVLRHIRDSLAPFEPERGPAAKDAEVSHA